MRTILPFLIAFLPTRAAGAAGGVEPPKIALVEIRDRIIRESQERIQHEILDRVLGKEKASVFVDVEVDLKARRKENIKAGAGISEQYREKQDKNSGFATNMILPGVPQQRSIAGDQEKGKPSAAQGQQAQQSKLEEEEVFSQTLDIKSFTATVIHDAALAAAPDWKGQVDAMRELIVQAMKAYQVKADDVVFRPARYHKKQLNWWDQLIDPGVYIPLVYASLLLLLLLFLFGPFRTFLRRYTDALVQKPAAEIHAETHIEPPEEGGAGGKGEGEGKEESMVELLVGRKPPEPPPPPPEPKEGEDAMAKYEPFTYVNEENLKNLANLFLVRREEPWLIATVLSYLRQDYARQVLTALPLELQTKVAMEALKVRQITREQLKAIDADVKENIDFVVGGIERLTRMLEEAEPATRENILESLKNERPVVYEHVRRAILLFEDIVDFPDREMQIVVRGLKTDSMARALQNAPPAVVEKFFKNMSPNAASLLKEAMEFNREVSPAQIEEERTKIMDHVKTMEKEGKITLSRGQAEGTGFQQVIAEDSARLPRLGALTGKPAAAPDEPKAPPTPTPATQVDPYKAQQFFNSGAQALAAGRLDEAVRYLRQAVEYDPSLWQAYQYLGNALYQMQRVPEALMYFEKVLQYNPDPQLRAWVETFKAQVRP